MSATDESLSVSVEWQMIVVRNRSAVDASPYEGSIRMKDIVEIVVERTEIAGEHIVHWFLRHPKGWTLHFNNRFLGASAAISELQEVLKFTVPDIAEIAGPGRLGTVVWSVK